MRMTSRKPPSGFQQRQELWRKQRDNAQPMRNAYPTAAFANVQLKFDDPAANGHAAQSHIFYPPARAYFAFPCPYGDCDGIYDLTEAVGAALGKEAASREGTLECKGVRARGGLQRQHCGLVAHYTLAAQYTATAVKRR
jgi:hypothetical protein